MVYFSLFEQVDTEFVLKLGVQIQPTPSLPFGHFAAPLCKARKGEWKY